MNDRFFECLGPVLVLCGALGIFFGMPGLLLYLSALRRKTKESQIQHFTDRIAARWTTTGHSIHLKPIPVNLEDDFTTNSIFESTPGALGIIGNHSGEPGNRVEFHQFDNRTLRFALADHQLRAYGRVNHADPLQIILCGESNTGWHGYLFTLLIPHQWTDLSAALYNISQISASNMIEPIWAMGYRQDMLGHWEQPQATMLFLIPQYLLLNWQTTIAFDHIRELSVLPSPGINPFNAAMLCIKYADAEGSLQTVGFDIVGGKAHTWAKLLHERSGATLSIVEQRKKKT